jgi:hypothetical protein
MSGKTAKRLNRLADALEKLVKVSLTWLADAGQLVAIDLTYGKARYRKRVAQPRPIIHRVYNRTIIYREPRTRERVYVVKRNK